MNQITKKMHVGTIGELLVQIRLLQYSMQTAPPIKDSGNDLIAVKGETFRAVSVRTTTTGRFQSRKPSGGITSSPSCIWQVTIGRSSWMNRRSISSQGRRLPKCQVAANVWISTFFRGCSSQNCLRKDLTLFNGADDIRKTSSLP